MVPNTPAQAVAELLNAMSKGQYLILVEAIKQLGGEMRLDGDAFFEAAAQVPPGLEVDADDGPIVIRFSKETSL
jgi:hypothetical protein